VVDFIERLIPVLGGIDLVLALALASRHARGIGQFVRLLRDPPAPAALRGYGDFVEILFYCWLLVFAASLLFPGEAFLEMISLGATLAITCTSIVYFSCLLALPRQP